MNYIAILLKKKSFYLCLIVFALGIGIGNYYGKTNIKSIQNQGSTTAQNGSLEFHSGGYKLINPLYACNTGENYGKEKLSDLESKIKDYIDKVTSNNSVASASVYFRDLNNGPWFGINEHADFAPSSLLKTPVMIAYFKEAQKDPTILTKQIKYSEDPKGLIQQNFPPKVTLEKGKSYTIDTLIERMIASSDNVALGLLEENIDPAKIDKVTLDLGITTATNATPDDFMDVQEYSTLFRVLYYATYLDKDYSEKALQILSRSEFTQGIVASIPRGITIAHKFGERHLEDGINQLHDCGIVYKPNRPYLVCIMTKGNNFNDLQTTIQQISSKIYLEFSQHYH